MTHGPNLACCLFLYSPPAKNGFHLFKLLRKKEKILMFCTM